MNGSNRYLAAPISSHPFLAVLLYSTTHTRTAQSSAVASKLTAGIGLLPGHLLHIHPGSLGDVEFIQLSCRWTRGEVLCLETDRSLEDLDEQGSTLRYHQ